MAELNWFFSENFLFIYRKIKQKKKWFSLQSNRIKIEYKYPRPSAQRHYVISNHYNSLEIRLPFFNHCKLNIIQILSWLDSISIDCNLIILIILQFNWNLTRDTQVNKTGKIWMVSAARLIFAMSYGTSHTIQKSKICL